MNLQGKNILITGAAKRIGREIALTCAEQGANILVHYRQSKVHADALCRELRRFGVKAEAIPLDLGLNSKEPFAKRLSTFVKKVYNVFPKIDVLINNASVFYLTKFGRISEKQWDDNLTVNAKAPFFLSQEIGQRMFRSGSGKIINLVDWVGMKPPLDLLPYAFSKATLVSVTYGLARVLAPKVQVNGISPGPILPPVGMTQKRKDSAPQRTLLKRYGSPQDIAAAVRFIIEGSDYITGTVISVDGGACIA